MTSSDPLSIKASTFSLYEEAVVNLSPWSRIVILNDATAEITTNLLRVLAVNKTPCRLTIIDPFIEDGVYQYCLKIAEYCATNHLSLKEVFKQLKIVQHNTVRDTSFSIPGYSMYTCIVNQYADNQELHELIHDWWPSLCVKGKFIIRHCVRSPSTMTAIADTFGRPANLVIDNDAVVYIKTAPYRVPRRE